MDETTTHDPRNAVLTHYLVMQSKHDTAEEVARLEGDVTEVAHHQLAQAILEAAMDAEDRDPDPRSGVS